MKVNLPLTHEQEENLLLNMIEAGTLFMDITFPDYPSPVTSLDLMFREVMGIESTIRNAIPQDVPRIIEFFDTLRLIEEGMAK